MGFNRRDYTSACKRINALSYAGKWNTSADTFIIAMIKCK